MSAADSIRLPLQQSTCVTRLFPGRPMTSSLVPPEFNEKNEVVKNARMTVYHNGVKVHDDVELPNRTTTAGPNKFGNERGPIFLQNHGNEVRYRNIWVLETGK